MSKSKVNQDNQNGWKLAFAIALVVIIILIISIASLKSGNSSTKQNGTTSTTSSFRNIRIDEDLSIDGTIKNLDNVRWNNARITQDGNSLEVSIYVNNESEKESVPAKTVTIILYDKDGNEIAKKDVEMSAIDAKYGYTTIETEFDITDPIIIGNIALIAK